MGNYLIIYNFIVILIDILGIWLAFWVYYKGRGRKVNLGLSFMIITLLSWITFYHFASSTHEPSVSLLLFRVSGGSVCLFLIAYYFFIVRWFLERKGFYKILGKFIVVYGFTLAFLIFFTNYIIEYSKLEEWGFHPVFSPWGWFVFYGYAMAMAIIVVSSLLLNYANSPLDKKLKIRFFLIGIISWTIINFIFNIILQVYFNSYQYYQFGNYSTLLLISFVTYAIVKNKLFGIKTFLATIFVIVLTIVYLIDFIIFIPNSNYQEIILKAGSLSILVIFGVLLIRSVRKEIKQREELEKLTNQLEKANKKLKKLDTLKDEFISIASHQLRTPLTVIKGYLSMIMEGDFGEVNGKQIDPMHKITESSDRLVQLVENILNVSRIESGRLKFNFTKVQLEDLVKSVVDELINKAKLKLLKLNFNMPALPLPRVKIDEEKMRQVVINLIDNSIKYTDKGSVTVDLKQSGNNLEFSVSDTGVGIKKDDLRKLFQKFSRGTGATSITEGTGLGLYVARQMVEAHKGKIWAQSKGEGMGSRFCFTLPIG